jgi:hypothetical protein
MRILVLGYIVRGPFGGMVWHHLQYVMGLRRLGHDVYFIEDSDDYASCYDAARGEMTTDPTYGLQYARGIFDRQGLGKRWAYFDAHQNRWHGPAGAGALELFRTADLLVNVSCVNPVREWTLSPPLRVLIDTDPVFTQVRHMSTPVDLRGAFTAFLTFGECFGTKACSIPDDGLSWRPTRQPIVLDAWPVVDGNPNGNFTTVMNWDSYRSVEYGGRAFGMKSASFKPYFDLPSRTTERLEIAMGGSTRPPQSFWDCGWLHADVDDVTRTPWSYQEYIRASKGEFSLAKHGYVESRSGWFSERSAAYLASGLPVITQETGFTDWLKADSGVIAFDSPDSAVDALRRVAADYPEHCRGARAVAREYFDSDDVLGDMIRQATRGAHVAQAAAPGER